MSPLRFPRLGLSICMMIGLGTMLAVDPGIFWFWAHICGAGMIFLTYWNVFRGQV